MLSKYIGEDGNYTREYLDHWEKMLEIIDGKLDVLSTPDPVITNTFECATTLTRYLLEFEELVITRTTRELNINSIIEEDE